MNERRDPIEQEDLDIATVLRASKRAGASDIHLTPDRSPLFRLDGELRAHKQLPKLDEKACTKLIYSFLSDHHRSYFEQHNELDFTYAVPSLGRFRVNVSRNDHGVTAALRPVPTRIPSMADLGLPQIVAGLTEIRNGLVLVCGPTGSGKSTTLAAMLEHINRTRRCHIVTLEDPIEFSFEDKRAMINQREIGTHTESFTEGLRRVLRQDPDVVLIGEIRDLETITAALTIAETGHLVFATLHTNGAVDTINRVIDVFPGDHQEQVRQQLSSTLRAVLAQILLPRADQDQGRIAVREIMIMNTGIQSLIRDSKVHQVYTAMEVASGEGMITLEQHLAQLYVAGLIDRDLAMRSSNEPGNFVALAEQLLAGDAGRRSGRR